MSQWQPMMLELIALIAEHGWQEDFDKAIANARKYNIPQLEDIKNLDDYLLYLNGLLTWVPSENRQGREIYNHLCKSYFIFDQPPVSRLQNKIIPHPEAPPLTPLSAWLVRYARSMGEFLDTPESLTPESLQSVYDSPNYNMSDAPGRAASSARAPSSSWSPTASTATPSPASPRRPTASTAPAAS